MGSRIYEPVPGHFAHDDVDQLPLPAVSPRFGLKDTSEDRWTKFQEHLRRMNEEAPAGTTFKFFLLSRHGEGYHNVAESKYGTIDWDEHWSKLNGDGEIVWGPDPQLTPLGVEQAHAIRNAWITEAGFGIPPPHRRYCSPLSRALHTCHVMFEDVFENHTLPVLVLENCREENGVHTCDKRNMRSYISSSRPHFDIDETLTELDELWHPTIRETKAEVADRARKILDHVFEKDLEHSFISITAHGGFINGFLTTIGREPFVLPTGGVIPVLVKAQNR